MTNFATLADVPYWAVSILLFVLVYHCVLGPVIFSPLAKVPTPHWSCSFSDCWILYARFRSKENRTLEAAHRRYGPIIRVGPREVSVNSIEAVKIVYQGGFEKHGWYSVFNNFGVPCMFSSLQGKHHSVRKRMVSNIYSKSYINRSISQSAQSDVVINSRLIPTLEESLSNGKECTDGLDVHSLFCAAAMEFISAYCFGIQRSSNFISDKSYREYWLKLYSTRKGYGFFAQELPILSSALRLLGIRLTPGWVDEANRELEAWCKGLSDATLEDLRKSGPSLDTANDPVVVRTLLAGYEKERRVHDSASPIYSTTLQNPELSIASEVFDHILAGQETTGVALTYLSHHLSQSLHLQALLRAELRTLRPSMVLQDGRVAMPDSKQLHSLPLLHAMIIETIRRYAPAGGPEPRVVPSPSCRLGMYQIPGRTRISASAFNIHRDERAYPCPEEWDYTRWLANGYQGSSPQDACRQFWGFSSGGRMCLGSNFAMHEMKLIIAAIYSNYTTHIVNDDGIEQTDMYTGHPKRNALDLRFERV
ncbi:cytochrome P450 [Xylariaceae sp. FL0594]|nr:cytochrome P450 [Xylariaceae sp. FL0594]